MQPHSVQHPFTANFLLLSFIICYCFHWTSFVCPLAWIWTYFIWFHLISLCQCLLFEHPLFVTTFSFQHPLSAIFLPFKSFIYYYLLLRHLVSANWVGMGYLVCQCRLFRHPISSTPFCLTSLIGQFPYLYIINLPLPSIWTSFIYQHLIFEHL